MRAAFVQAVRQRQASGEIDPSLDPDAVARAMIALFQGLILQRTWYRKVDVEGYSAVVRALLGGLRRPQLAEATAPEG